MSIPRGPAPVRNSDYCLLCGFSVSTKSVNGMPEGEVCHQCSHLKTGLWKLPTLLREMDISEAHANEIVYDVVSRCNLNFDPESEKVSIWGATESVQLPRTAHSLREARLNTKVKWVYARSKKMKFENKVLVVSKEKSPTFSHRCIARLGRSKQCGSIDNLESLMSAAFDSCETETSYLVPTRDQLIFIPEPKKSGILTLVAALLVLYSCIICLAYLVNLDVHF
eukprot:TRINITY_DN20984_c0_g1_i1.p1 TRINITY_DN20984_c0_g1~~TRINITY_DN20984_c0_g1_i1.p1  ORF type:complete len:224 (+),score=25.51 TRINITY_DN20984_c0_g1_i1:65-736(+)